MSLIFQYHLGKSALFDIFHHYVNLRALWIVKDLDQSDDIFMNLNLFSSKIIIITSFFMIAISF